MRRTLTLILTAILLVSSAWANDCVPLAYRTLSRLTGQQVSYTYWHRSIMPDDKAPDTNRTIVGWNKRFNLTPLVCVYSRFRPVDLSSIALTPFKPRNETPYFWLGEIPPELVGDPTEVGQGHAAIVIFHAEFVELISPLDPFESRYLVERLSYWDFGLRTHAVYEVRSILPIQWRKLIE